MDGARTAACAGPILAAALLLVAAAIDAADPPPAQDPGWGDLRIEAGGGAGTMVEREAITDTPSGGSATAVESDQRVRVDASRLALGQLGPIASGRRSSSMVVGYEVALERLGWSDELGRWSSTRASLDAIAGGALALGARARVELAALIGAGIARWRMEGAGSTARSPFAEGGLRADVAASWRCGLVLGVGGQLLGDTAHATLRWINAFSGDADALALHARALHAEAFAAAGWRF